MTTGAAVTVTVAVLLWMTPMSSVRSALTVKVPAPVVDSVVLVPLAADANAAPAPPLVRVQATLAIVRPVPTVLPATLTVIVCPAMAPAGVAAMTTDSPVLAACAKATAAPASSMPAPQVLVVQ